MSNPFSGIGSARVYGAGQYITPGQYELQVTEVKLVNSEKDAGRQFFCVEGTVLNANEVAFESGGWRAGSTVTWLVDMRQPSALSNCKQFALALTPELSENDIDESAMMGLVGPDQPAKGLKIDCDAINIKTKSGNDFTKCQWRASGTLFPNV